MGRVTSFIHKTVISSLDMMCHIGLKKQFKRYCIAQGLEKQTNKEAEQAYVDKWSVLGMPVERFSFRFYSAFMEDTAAIVPEAVGHRKIEIVLNPSRYCGFYSDKNLYKTYLKEENLPKAFLRRINRGVENSDYQRVADINKIIEEIEPQRLILKPTVDSESGRGVVLFTKSEDGFHSVIDGRLLNSDYLLSFGSDFVLQEAVIQSDFFTRLCKTSVNTIRIATYKSVVDDEPHVLASIIRVGKDGSFVDNAHAGGRFVGVDVKTGELGKYVIDQYGNKLSEWNGINYEHEEMRVPEWDKVIEFAKYVARQNKHLRLLALDICISETGKPILIEYNCTGFSYWLFMLTNQRPFGNFDEEIIEYCRKNARKKFRIQV